ncbi:MAG TPA: serine protease [Kiritimatiellia bacterium]|nr:serine protease [Kiritimatiellia bacterium]HRZ12466.1 serine protease [Kiritimatiellia bacterium]HSA17776.1 serine protease [Kiritimatiellia bacterium]
MKHARPILALLLAAILPAAADPAPNPEYVDGYQTINRFAKRLGKLVQAKSAVPMKALIEQAKTFKPCALEALPSSGAVQSPEEIYASCRDSVVLVGAVYKCKKCARWHLASATGFAVSDDGLIVTSRHVVSSNSFCEAMGILTRDGRLFPVKEVAASDPRNDLVILRTDAQGLRPLPVAEDISVGAPVYAIHHANPNLYAFTQGAVVGKFLSGRLNPKEPLRTLAISADYAPGSSGGPIFDQHGAVAGIVCSVSPVMDHGHDSTNVWASMIWKYSVPSDALLELMEAPVPP